MPDWTWVDYVFKALIVGTATSMIVIGIRSLKAKADAPLPAVEDQPCTWGAMTTHCEKERGRLEEKVMNEVEHFRTEFQKDLERGEKRFDELTEEQRKTNGVLQEICTNLKLLKQEVAKQNGG